MCIHESGDRLGKSVGNDYCVKNMPLSKNNRTLTSQNTHMKNIYCPFCQYIYTMKASLRIHK